MNSMILVVALGRLQRNVSQRLHHRRVRRRVRAMLQLDDKLLDDIGVLRSEVEWAARLPISENAALALRDRGYLRRKGKPYPGALPARAFLVNAATSKKGDDKPAVCAANVQPCCG